MEKFMINLQLFATQTTLLDTEGNDLSPEMKVYYQDRLIDYAEPNLVYDQFADKYPIPPHGGKTTEFRKYSPLSKALTTLTEGVTPDGNKLDVQTIEATVSQYGDYIEISDMLDLTAIDRNLEQATKLLGSQAGRTLDTVTREVVTAGTQVQYAPYDNAGTMTEVTDRNGLQSNSYLTVEEIYKAVAQLDSMNAQKIDGSYVGIVHPNTAMSLMASDGFQEIHKYARPENLYNGEIGSIGGVRFVSSSEAKVIGPAVVNAVSAATSSATAFVLKNTPDAAAVAYLTGDSPTLNIGGTEYTVASYAEATKTVTLSAAASLSKDAVVLSTDAGSTGESVYLTMIVGANAYATTDITGGGLQHIVKQLGSSGTSDPLNQRATTGWKATKVAERLVDEYMVRIEHTNKFGAKVKSN